MKNVTLSAAILFAGIMVSCGSDGSLDDLTGGDGESVASLYIDNGVDTTVNVTIETKDGKKTWDFEIEGYSGESTSIPHGDYHVTAVTVTDSTVVDEDFSLDVTSYEYNLNLTKEDYIVEKITYYIDPTDADPNVSFTYDGQTYAGWDADVIKGKLVIASDWDYNLDEETPEEVELYAGESQTTKRKLWRASTFVLLLQLEMLLEEYGEDYDWESEEGAF